MISESRLLLALFNGAWQSGLVCALAYLALLSTRRLNATNIHGVWNVLLCVSIALPIANYAFTKPAVTTAVRPVIGVHAVPQRASTRGFPTAQRDTDHVTPQQVKTRLLPDVGAMWFDAELWALRHARGFLLVMAALAALKLAVLLKDLIVMLRLRRRVTPIEAPVDVTVCGSRVPHFAVTQELQTPCVLGFAKPLIVLPSALLEEGNPGQLRDVVAHEAAHVKRWDDVQNFIHRAIAGVLFFDPGVMVALHELAIARESACDDAVLEARQDRIAYATTLSGMALWARRHSIAVPSLIFGKKQLIRRIEQLLDRKRDHTVAHDQPLTIGALIVVGVAAFALVHYQVPAVAQTVASAVQKSLTGKPEKPVQHEPSTASRLLALAQEQPALRVDPAKVEAPKPAVVVEKRNVIAPAVKTARATPVVRLQSANVAVSATSAWSAATLSVAPIAGAGYAHAHAHSFERCNCSLAGPIPPKKTDLLDALDAGGYHNLTADQLISLSNHGVGSCLIEQAGKSFSQRPTIDELISMADNGVSCSYLRDLVTSGLQSLTPKQVIGLAQQGVSMSYTAAVRNNLRNATIEDITRLAQHGVSSELIIGVSQRRYNPSVDQLLQLADHGVSLKYIDSVNRKRSSQFSLDDIVRLHDSGFSPSDSHT